MVAVDFINNHGILLLCWTIIVTEAIMSPTPTCNERIQNAQNTLESLSTLEEECNVELGYPREETPDDEPDRMLTIIEGLKNAIDRMTNCTCARKENGHHGYTVRSHYEAFDYPVIFVDDAVRWKLFWWFKSNSTWPALVSDVLQDKYGDCDVGAPYCFSRLPEVLQERVAELLAVDSDGNVYRWKFDPENNVAHAVWRAFHDHEYVKVTNGNPWNPKVVSGTAPKATQDSFHYRMEHGVASLQIDDDNCDCMTSLSMGHGMCGDGFSTTYGPENVFGVDLLYDHYCQTPSPKNGLRLYFRDDDDCINVTCPPGLQCKDGVHSYTCR
ncbi:unnamed protein product [Owenia fusiformis]|uniref:Uncharacterized protein n=2 Tax=Owenia fusiformis TaxID=6347 RepID=A0A8S4NKW6_OWEFU|nr:unnamed protein product [Owenia fusiformis]